MNNFILDENQLRRLKYFIWQKGIKDADAINEVIDHFACKVEELMNEHIYLPLDKAMQQAYISFGKDGFKIIIEQYRKQIAAIYWKEFRIAFKELLDTKLFIIGIVWSVLLGISLYYILTLNIDNWIESAFIYSSLLSALGCYCYQGLSFWNSEKKNDFFYCERKNLILWQKTVQRMPRIESLNLLFIILFGTLKLNGLAFIYGMMCLSFISLINHFTRKETRKRMSLKLSFK